VRITDSGFHLQRVELNKISLKKMLDQVALIGINKYCDWQDVAGSGKEFPG
jgi:hypothetical protein